MASEQRKPNPIDIHVGSRIRLRRTMLGLSQEKLGDALGITFQQIQKYEKGANRVGASRLQEISRVLKTPVAFFFEGAPGQDTSDAGFKETSSANYVVDFLSSNEGLQLNRAFVKIEDPKVRKKLVELAKALANISEE
ncbi:helix-turn-helix domain-containing protein [Salaquimonas pukyongi]|uniref:helix-turn-helix domain-containing protein n=1 Tax=Salaquimonas pukyongi TaxID=2712698 RepID=UPI00096B8454|nr:helix-turn-helix transcriptional regulator [Salaquimonas pukyongi]